MQCPTNKAIMLISREFMAEMGFGTCATDKLKTDQTARDELCSLLKLPIGTSILDCQWNYDGINYDRFAFLVVNPDFPKIDEGRILPYVDAIYSTNGFTTEPQFSGWRFTESYGVPLQQCEWFKNIRERGV